MSKINTQQSAATLKKQTSLADKNTKSKAKPPSKELGIAGSPLIKMDPDPSKPPLKEYPEMIMEGFKTVITELLKEDRIRARESRRLKQRI